MNKYHVKSNGDIGRCTAEEGKCPFTSDGAAHFTNKEDAYAFSELVIARLEGGSFSQPALTKTEMNQTKTLTLPPDVLDPNSYTEEWEVSKHMGHYIEEGGYFSMRDKIYQAHDWSWNRATLWTTITASNVTDGGEPEEIVIHQGSEGNISFIDKNAIAFSNGKRIKIKDLANEIGSDSAIAQEVAAALNAGNRQWELEHVEYWGISAGNGVTKTIGVTKTLVLHNFQIGDQAVWAVSNSRKREEVQDFNQPDLDLAANAYYFEDEYDAGSFYNSLERDIQDEKSEREFARQKLTPF